MKSVVRICLLNGATGLAAVSCLFSLNSRAGEAIQFSNARNRADPTSKSKLTDDKDFGKLGKFSPLDFIPPGGDSLRHDPVRDRKVKNAATERANWIMLDRGQLDAQDDARRASGLQDPSFEKESDRKDYFFTPSNEKDGLKNSPFAKPAAGDRSEPNSDPKDAQANGTKVDETSEARHPQVLGKNGQALGEHTVRELDLKDLLSSGKANSLTPAADRTASIWKEVLGGSGDSNPARRHDETSTADSFRGSVASGSARSMDSFNFRNDMTPRTAPASPLGISDSAPRSFSVAAPPAALRASDSGLGRSPGFYGTPAGNEAASAQAGGPGNDPYAAYRAQASRSSSSSFQIPSRPGYGR